MVRCEATLTLRVVRLRVHVGREAWRLVLHSKVSDCARLLRCNVAKSSGQLARRLRDGLFIFLSMRAAHADVAVRGVDGELLFTLNVVQPGLILTTNRAAELDSIGMASVVLVIGWLVRRVNRSGHRSDSRPLGCGLRLEGVV